MLYMYLDIIILVVVYLMVGGSSLMEACMGHTCIVDDLNFGAPSKLMFNERWNGSRCFAEC